MSEAEQYGEPLDHWLRDVTLVWKRILDLTTYFNNVRDDAEEEDTARYTLERVSAKISFAWEEKKQENALRTPARARATRLVYTTKAATLNGQEATEVTEADTEDATKSTRAKGKSGNGKRKREDSNATDWPIKSNKRSSDPCIACNGKNHRFTACFLALGTTKSWIPKENKDFFNEKMKTPSFKTMIDEHRKAISDANIASEAKAKA